VCVGVVHAHASVSVYLPLCQASAWFLALTGVQRPRPAKGAPTAMMMKQPHPFLQRVTAHARRGAGADTRWKPEWLLRASPCEFEAHELQSSRRTGTPDALGASSLTRQKSSRSNRGRPSSSRRARAQDASLNGDASQAKGSRREEGRAQEEAKGRAGRGGVAHRAGASPAQSVTADQQGAAAAPTHPVCSPCTQAACQHARLRPHPLPSRRPHSALALAHASLSCCFWLRRPRAAR
jgi:hypothetical protein